MSSNKRMNKENVLHLHSGVLLNFKKKYIMKFAGKLIELEQNILNEITQTEKDK